MTDDKDSLEKLRQDIDRVDRRIHELLVERSGVVAAIGRAKRPDGIFIRPGRHANVLRRLAARHTGPFPLMALLRVWNEIIGPMTQLQGPLSMAVHEGLLDTAREFYGSYIPATTHGEPAALLAAVAEGQATVGVLPLPGQGPRWWPLLLERPDARVVARLPFLGDARPALVVARMHPEASGRDHAVVADPRPAPEADLAATLRRAGLTPLAPLDDAEPAVMAVEGFVAADDPRVAELAAAGLALLGGYPVPMAMEPEDSQQQDATER